MAFIRTMALAAVLGSALGCAPSARQLEGHRQQIEDLLHAQVEAWNRGDLDGYLAGYWAGPELTFSSGGDTTRGFEPIRAEYQAAFPTPEQMGHLVFDDLHVRLLGPRAALALGNWYLERGEERMEGNFSLVLERFGDDWRIIHDHTSRKP